MAPPTASGSGSNSKGQPPPKITITAVHRDSLAKPRHMAIPPNEQQIFAARPPTVEPSNRPAAPNLGLTKPTTPTVSSNREPGSTADESYAGWMNQWGHEPPDDTETCCLGVWAPCVLYGKTHWRFMRLTKGEDPLDSNWRSKDGCNGCCWAWFGLNVIGLGCKFSSGYERIC